MSTMLQIYLRTRGEEKGLPKFSKKIIWGYKYVSSVFLTINIGSILMFYVRTLEKYKCMNSSTREGIGIGTTKISEKLLGG